MSREITVLQNFVLVECANCCMSFGIPARFDTDRRNDHARFYCPHGHTNIYSQQSEAERLAAQLTEERRLRGIAELDRAKVLIEMKRIGERITNGVCPCCNRSFKDLRSHMKSKHSTVKAIA